MKKNYFLKNGFTLIEVLAVMGIFSIVLGAVIGVFFSGLRAQRRALLVTGILDNISYNLEYMSRALRMAKKDDLPIGGITKDCSGGPGDKVNYIITRGGRGIKFRNYKNECQEFFLDGEKIKEVREGQVNVLTPDSFRITSFALGQSGWGQNDDLQPRATLSLEVRFQDETIKFQTTISQRDLDVRY